MKRETRIADRYAALIFPPLASEALHIAAAEGETARDKTSSSPCEPALQIPGSNPVVVEAAVLQTRCEAEIVKRNAYAS